MGNIKIDIVEYIPQPSNIILYQWVTLKLLKTVDDYFKCKCIVYL